MGEGALCETLMTRDGPLGGEKGLLPSGHPVPAMVHSADPATTKTNSGGVAQQVKALPGVTGSHVVGGENTALLKLSLDLHTYAMTCTCISFFPKNN